MRAPDSARFAYRLRVSSGFVIFVLGLVIGLDTTGLNFSSLLVVGGSLGVGIGFGLQNIVANFVAGHPSRARIIARAQRHLAGSSGISLR